MDGRKLVLLGASSSSSERQPSIKDKPVELMEEELEEEVSSNRPISP